MRVCLIGATHPSHNPRLLREADSLAEAGHDVRVVAPNFVEELSLADEKQLANRKWRLESFDFRPLGWRGRGRSFLIRGRRKLVHTVVQKSGITWLTEHSYTLALKELTKIAEREPADWFIAHAHPALAIAARAATRWHAKLGFDCEDLLSVVADDSAKLARQIERVYLRRCDYVSTPSKGIANSLVREYNIPQPLVLYNVFPLYLADGMIPPARRPRHTGLRCFWFSQTIGPGRGLEEAIEACGLAGQGIELHLRGTAAAGYDHLLSELARSHQVKLVFHPRIDHDELIKSMDQFDVGLALERSDNPNYALTVTNKIGSYLLAGLAVAATDTPGQREIMEHNQAAGFFYSPGSAQPLAAGLRRWLEDRDSLRAAQQTGWDATRQRFCWDLESNKFFKVLGLEPNQDSREDLAQAV